MKKKELYIRIKKHKYLYILLLPTIAFYIIFSYVPMYGVVLAFKELNYAKGILGSPYVGFSNFEEIFALSGFWNAVKNTVIIGFSRIIIEFPIPIIISILLYEVKNIKLRKFYQSVYIFPHFISWVVIGGMMINIMGDAGIVNQVLQHLGFSKQNILVNTSFFRPFLYLTNIWKEMGWNTIIYLAAIACIDKELYEAAIMDGANRWQRIKHITIPGIRNTAGILFILAMGRTMSAAGSMTGGGFAQIFNMYNSAVYEVADIIDTYIYRRTFAGGGDFGTSTAIGLFKSVLNFVLLYSSNKFVKKIGGQELV